jgi:hypothetical protein
MIANFFRTLTNQRVEYLLISGQASVLYGAATFSEDIDLWINPTASNCDRFVAALRACGAHHYKLTPPLTVQNLQGGHGFHFLLPATDEPAIFLDVLGAPPRVGDFNPAVATAQWMDSPWGRLHVIGLQPLVELKKTQRLEDYPVISKLVLAWLAHPEQRGTADLLWAMTNIFTIPELRLFFETYPEAADLAVNEPSSGLPDFGRQLRLTGDVSEAILEQVTVSLQQRIAYCQQADRLYWRPIIAGLRSLRQAGQLMTEGDPV